MTSQERDEIFEAAAHPSASHAYDGQARTTGNMPDLQALLAATASRPAQLLSVKLAERPPSSHCNIENQPFNESSPMEGVGNDAQFELKKRKLWTRLHSALQRAIDDLYVLCEVECNLWQVQNAIQLLDESTHDFRQLQVRLKSQEMHARERQDAPHTCKSIAWEVRPTQSSPRHAEMISSIHDRVTSASPTSDKHLLRSSSHEPVSSEQLRRSFGSPLSGRSSEQAQRPHSAHASIGAGRSCEQAQPPCRGGGRTDASLECSSSSSWQAQEGQRMEKSREAMELGMRGPSQTWTDAGEHASTSGADEADLRTSTEYADSLGWESEGCPSTPRATEAWKEKRNWSEILDQHGDGGGGIGGVGGGGLQKGRTLHQLLMSPERNRRKTPAQIKALIDEKHARAQRLRDERETQRMARLAQAEAVRQAVQTSQADVVERKRADIDERQARSAELRQAHLAEIRLKAGDETKKVHEVLFITSLQTQDRKLSLQQRLQETEQRRRQQLAKIQQRQRETEVAMQGAQERRHQLEAERRERIAGREKRAAAAAAKLEEERRALELARSQRAEQQRLALEQQKRAAEEEAERRQHRLASRLREAGMRRLSHLDQIRDRAAISKDERDSCPPMSPTKRPRSREVVAVIREVSASDDERRPQPLQTVDRSLTFSQVPANRLKGMRRRAAKLMARLDANRVTVIEDESLLGGREGMAVRDTLSRALADLQHVHGKHDAVGLEAGVGRVMQLLDSTRALGLNAARQVGLLEFVARALTPTQPPWPHRLDMALLALLLRLLLVEANCDFLLGGNLLAPIIPQLVAVLDRCNGREGVVELGAGQDGVLLNALLKVVVLALWHQPTIPAVLAMREHAVGYLLAAGVVHRLHELFSLFDPMASPEGTPYPAYLEQALRLLAAIAYHPVQPLGADKRRMARSQNAPALILTLKEVTLAGLLSLLTAVLLHAAPSSTPGGDAERPALPSNFCSVALGVLRVLNNAAFMDLAAMQRMLGSLDLRVEIFHVISFLLTFCTRQWHEAADQVKGLLNELLLLIGFFGVLEPCNQDVLQWGKAPNVVQKLCMLPAAYFSNRSLMHVLFPTLLVACYQNERICEVVEYQMGMHSLLAYVQQAAVADLASSSVPGSKASVPVVSSSTSTTSSSYAVLQERLTNGNYVIREAMPRPGPAPLKTLANAGLGLGLGRQAAAAGGKLVVLHRPHRPPSKSTSSSSIGSTSSSRSSRSGLASGFTSDRAAQTCIDQERELKGDDLECLDARYRLAQRFPLALLSEAAAFLQHRLELSSS